MEILHRIMEIDTKIIKNSVKSNKILTSKRILVNGVCILWTVLTSFAGQVD
jgi:hypothetical protein